MTLRDRFARLPRWAGDLAALAVAACLIAFAASRCERTAPPAPAPASVSRVAPEAAKAAQGAPIRPRALPAPAPVAKAAPGALKGAVIRYELPDGQVGFTDDEKRVPAKATRVVRGYQVADRWTYAGPARWNPAGVGAFRPDPAASAEERVWRAEQRRAERRLEEAQALARAFPRGDLGGALDRRVRDAERALDRVADDCRRSAVCQPGYLR